ncbi:MAG: SpoIIE family protein phosphatase [Chloroflexota bacterium]|nr:SpoIIE family protein phosphatase [Chloroflexota bacterium]
MATLIQNFKQNLSGRKARQTQAMPVTVPERAGPDQVTGLDIAPNDPLVAYFLSAPGAVEIDKLHMESPALQSLKAAGVQLVVPMVSQGELVGLLNLGPRLSEQDYSTDDRGLLSNLASQAAPAVRVAQLVRQQHAEARERERLEQELRVARLIQQTLLPKELPAIPGWQVAAYYQPARAVGGDFYDFLYFDDGRLGLVIGDVTDKGVPAALVMATTRSTLRSAAQNGVSPGQALERTNNLLCPDIPPKMFVTCLYAILEPSTGKLVYANAGHDLPYHRHRGGVDELRATGMPLGLMTGMRYEERETTLAPGDSVLFYSDGLVEAHNPEREMFSFPRLMSLMEEHAGGKALIDYLLGQLASFTGEGWEQEDDVSLVTLQRSEGYGESMVTNVSSTPAGNHNGQEGWRTLADFTLPSAPDNERQVMEEVARAVEGLNLPPKRLERLKTAVAETALNAMEHGNHFQAELPVAVKVQASDSTLSVLITDQGGGRPIPEAQTPDLEAKLAGLQTPRGWGLFLIKNLVDDMHVDTGETHHTVELVMNLGGNGHGN